MPPSSNKNPPKPSPVHPKTGNTSNELKLDSYFSTLLELFPFLDLDKIGMCVLLPSPNAPHI